jgi:enoyl-[acyl-carrier protein] reductase II
MNAAPALAGQSIGLIDEIKSVDSIINGTITQFNEICKNMGNHNFRV